MPLTENAISVAYVEITEPSKSPVERVDNEKGLYATRVLQCEWNDRLTLASELLNGYELVVGGYRFVYGQKYPHADKCFVKRIANIEPFGKSTGSGTDASWPTARLTVEYEPSAFDLEGLSTETQEPEVIYDEELGITAEFMTLPNKKLYWDASQSDPIENPESPGFLVRMREWTAEFRTKDNFPASVDTFTGTVNSGIITSKTLGITFAAETLLYQSPRIKHQRLSDGSNLYTIQLRFTHRPGGWNKFYKSGVEDPVDIYDDAGAVFKPYPTNDFTDLYV